MYVVCLLFYAIGKVVVFSFSFLGVLGSTAQRGMVMLLFLYKLNDAINTGWLVRCGINEDICNLPLHLPCYPESLLLQPFHLFLLLLQGVCTL